MVLTNVYEGAIPNRQFLMVAALIYYGRGECMSQFSEEQKKAIEHKDGPLMVLAGPGSGKTTVITYRVKTLIEVYGVRPENILVITYTKAAATEMQQRFNHITGNTYRAIFGTFHSVFFWILKNAYGYTTQNIIDESSKYTMLRERIHERELGYDHSDEFLKNIISEISYVKSEMLDIGAYSSANMKPEDFRAIFSDYQKLLTDNGKIDFDDMLVYAYELFCARKDILKSWQRMFKYILVDEFQDINSIQYKILCMLAAPDNNLFVVGDDDQSVYSFRGASPDIMLGFPDDFKDSGIVRLSVNYRCSKCITEAAGRLIANNKNRYEKNIVSAYEGDGLKRIKIKTVKDVREQNDTIIDDIRRLTQAGIPYGNMAVISRTNTEVHSLATKLMLYNIPFKMKESMPDIYNHFIADNIMAYVKIAMGDNSRRNYLKIINRPNRYISRDRLSDDTIDLSGLMNEYSGNYRIVRNLVVLENDLKRIKDMSPWAGINYIRRGVGYNEYIREYCRYRDIETQEFEDIMDEIQDMAKGFGSYDEWFDFIEEYKNELTEINRSRNDQPDAITIATMHGSKGLEFDHVFIIDAVEDITPHKKSKEPGQLEEERRMFYVAVTRARYGLNIYVPRYIRGRKAEESRFVDEMICPGADLKAGVRVSHKKYGVGLITFADDQNVMVAFDSGESKKLNKAYIAKNRLITIL